MNGKTIAECRPHWCNFIFHGGIGFLGLVIGILAFLNGGMQIGIFALGIMFLCVAYIFITYKFTYVFLTATKIEGHIGFIKSKTLSTPISKIQGISLSNGLLGKIFRYHTISISNARTDTTEYVFKRMAHAKEFVNAMEIEAANQR